MKRKPRAGIHIRDIEFELFHYLHLNKVASSFQIARDIYKDMAHQSIYRRLNKLIAKQLVISNGCKELRNRMIYSLSPRAFDEYICTEDQTLRKELKSANVMHDLTLVDIAYHFKKYSSVKNYCTENFIMIDNESCDLDSFRNVRSDAIVEIEFPNGTHQLAVEYEASRKYVHRYQSFFEKYYQDANISGVLFIAKDYRILREVSAIERKHFSKCDEKFFYILLDDLLNSDGQKLVFKTHKGETLAIN